MNTEEELTQIAAVLERLGAEPGQAEIMAAQLIKRADQWVEERGLSRVEAMQQLLELVVSGRSGETPPGFEGQSGGSDG